MMKLDEEHEDAQTWEVILILSGEDQQHLNSIWTLSWLTRTS